MDLLAANFNAAKRLLYLLPEKDILQFLARNQKSWSRIQLLRMQKAWTRILDKAGLPKAEQSSVFLQAVCESCREKDGRIPLKDRSAERRVGKGGVRPGRSGWSVVTAKKNNCINNRRGNHIVKSIK